jgi:hypothetical protein
VVPLLVSPPNPPLFSSPSPSPPAPPPRRREPTMAEGPVTAEPVDPLVEEIADALVAIERNYQREGSGPGSRFEGKRLEVVQAEFVVRKLLGGAR